MQELKENNRGECSKFTRQAADLGAVFIYKEGLFSRAYNEGAYGFIHQIMACKPLRRYVKSAGTDRVVCGIPLTALVKIPGFAQASQLDSVTWRWPLATPVEFVRYQAWRETLPLANGTATAALPPVVDYAQRLIDQLIQFNVATSTPMAALNLVADLQQQWFEREVD
jgi:hypothetical protein